VLQQRAGEDGVERRVRERQAHHVAGDDLDAIDRFGVQVNAGGRTGSDGRGEADRYRSRAAAQVEQGHSRP
jgi:hypothetical protein